jgi:hypothetical protein
MDKVFDNIDYLQTGNAHQQKAYVALVKHAIFTKLCGFDPILVGTIPINIHTKDSDLDVICCYTDHLLFKHLLVICFGKQEAFTIRELEEPKAIVANFKVDGFEIEVFGQDIPTRQQRGYRHMLVEHALLEKHGETFRQQVIALKEQGIKTEPAFAQLLGLSGDPYTALLAFEKQA